MRAEDSTASTYPRLSDAAREAALFEGQRRVLSLLSRGAPLAETLEALCFVIEERLPDALCSVLLFDREHETLHHGAAPRLPETYCRAIDGVHVGPSVGSCGTAAFLRMEISVEDIASDPLWDDYRELAMAAGLFACCSVPVFSAEGDVLGTFAIYHSQPGPFAARDLELLRAMTELTTVVIETDRRRAALMESEERFRNIVAQTGQVIYDLEPGRHRAVWSGAIEELFGEEPAMFAAPSIAAFLPRIHVEDQERVAGELLRPSTGEERRSVQLEYRVPRSDGSCAHVVQRGTALFDEYGNAKRHYGVLADVTEQRRTEAALREKQKLDSLGLLAGGIAHDFNNLLCAMLGNLSLAQLVLPPESPAAPHLQHLDVAIQRATALTRQMLAYSGRGQFVVRAVDVSDTVREVATILSAGLPKKVALKLELTLDPTTVEADASQLQQVVLNLVANAVEAVGDAEGTIVVSTALRDLDANDVKCVLHTQDLMPGRYVVLQVSDTGRGMEPEVASRIFDPFFSTKGAGRGLGLSAMAGILRTHRAGIEMRSELGCGTTFTLYFPISTRKAEPKPATQAVKVPAPRGRNILLVDDEPALRRIARQALTQQGLKVVEAADGVEALEVLQQRRGQVDLVIMDLTMPRMGGREALSVIHELDPSLPVILCSGYDQADTLSKMSGPMPSMFLQKPYRLADLEEAVRAILAGPAPEA